MDVNNCGQRDADEQRRDVLSSSETTSTNFYNGSSIRKGKMSLMKMNQTDGG